MEPYLSALRNEVVLAGHTHTYGRNILEKETNQTGLTKGKKKKGKKVKTATKPPQQNYPWANWIICYGNQGPPRLKTEQNIKSW